MIYTGQDRKEILILLRQISAIRHPDINETELQDESSSLVIVDGSSVEMRPEVSSIQRHLRGQNSKEIGWYSIPESLENQLRLLFEESVQRIINGARFLEGVLLLDKMGSDLSFPASSWATNFPKTPTLNNPELFGYETGYGLMVSTSTTHLYRTLDRLGCLAVEDKTIEPLAYILLRSRIKWANEEHKRQLLTVHRSTLPIK